MFVASPDKASELPFRHHKHAFMVADALTVPASVSITERSNCASTLDATPGLIMPS